MKKSNLYFPNLTSIRFFAAFAVIIHHIEQNKYNFGLANFWDVKAIKLMGGLGVDLFFVLSGFLISYLLLVEQEKFGKIKIKSFYIRRVLRIWPLYFIMIILGLIFLPYLAHMNDWTFDWDDYQFGNIVLFILFSANFAMAFYGSTTGISHTWSVATEEQFYLLWPLLFRFIKNKFKLMLGVIILYLVIKITLFILIQQGWGSLKNWSSYWSMFRVELMAIGGVLAVLIFNKRYEKIKNRIINNGVFITACLILIILLSIGFESRYIIHEVYGILFGLLVANLAVNKSLSGLLELKVFKELGKISYGLYMYHPLIIIILFNTIPTNLLKIDIIIYSLVIISTVVISYLSYYFIELKFLRMKNRYF